MSRIRKILTPLKLRHVQVSNHHRNSSLRFAFSPFCSSISRSNIFFKIALLHGETWFNFSLLWFDVAGLTWRLPLTRLFLLCFVLFVFILCSGWSKSSVSSSSLMKTKFRIQSKHGIRQSGLFFSDIPHLKASVCTYQLKFLHKRNFWKQWVHKRVQKVLERFRRNIQVVDVMRRNWLCMCYFVQWATRVTDWSRLGDQLWCLQKNSINIIF